MLAVDDNTFDAGLQEGEAKKARVPWDDAELLEQLQRAVGGCCVFTLRYPPSARLCPKIEAMSTTRLRTTGHTRRMAHMRNEELKGKRRNRSARAHIKDVVQMLGVLGAR